ncbi:TraB/GumN family protein [Novosphingobium aquimarinum]|uniref:TraB/GumN family protein n=1 Tax=Novosphingobium aquimarinum TaxID=2682494 RepID=UPI001E326FE1|nr:TraB/GumN family protein [Novosphingobium aquimarinum]
MLCPALRTLRIVLGPILLLVLAQCAPASREADPALWRVEGRNGEVAWLFGTIHAADGPMKWKTPDVARALAASDEIVVEVADMDPKRLTAQFDALSHTANLPPLLERVPPSDRKALATRLDDLGLEHDAFADVETWAAAMTLARAAASNADPSYGIDRAVIAAAGNRPVRELEGADAQLRIFDALPEEEQRDLLRAILVDPDAGERALPDSWARGDMEAIVRETKRGLLADPELRAALFTGRNKRWVDKIVARLGAGHRPFVAVGAAHLAGPEGLPALLAAAGYRVIRVR